MEIFQTFFSGCTEVIKGFWKRVKLLKRTIFFIQFLLTARTVKTSVITQTSALRILAIILDHVQKLLIK